MVAHNVLLTTEDQPPPRLDLVSEKPYRFVPPYHPRELLSNLVYEEFDQAAA
jgi:hypothetical protein